MDVKFFQFPPFEHAFVTYFYFPLPVIRHQDDVSRLRL